jgi:hypothetical protein
MMAAQHQTIHVAGKASCHHEVHFGLRDQYCIGLTLEDTKNLNFQIRKVFACPIFSLEATVERVNFIIDHVRNPSDAMHRNNQSRTL